MLSSRPFARPFVIVWLLALALLLVGPVSAYAKVEIVNGQDGAEGDPIDGFEGSSGGSGTYVPPLGSGTKLNDYSQFIVIPTYGLATGHVVYMIPVKLGYFEKLQRSCSVFVGRQR